MPPPPHSEITEWVREKQIDRWDSLGWNSFDPKADAEMASSKFNFESTRSGNHPTYFQAGLLDLFRILGFLRIPDYSNSFKGVVIQSCVFSYFHRILSHNLSFYGAHFLIFE